MARVIELDQLPTPYPTPRNPRERAKRDQMIVIRHALGETAAALAEAFGLSERQVWRIVSYWRDADWPYEEIL